MRPVLLLVLQRGDFLQEICDALPRWQLEALQRAVARQQGPSFSLIPASVLQACHPAQSLQQASRVAMPAPLHSSHHDMADWRRDMRTMLLKNGITSSRGPWKDDVPCMSAYKDQHDFQPSHGQPLKL